ncbi:MAG: FG-GAP-like repeat-containing protein [Opitutaceae bacterium]
MRIFFIIACFSFTALGAVPLSEQAARTGSFVLRDAAGVGIDFVHRWTPPERYRKTFDHSGAGGVAIGDFDGDGKPDVFLTRPFGGAKLYRNLGGWKFQDVTAQSGVEREQRWAGGATWADVDGDGDLDLAVCGYDCANRLWRNNGDGTFTEIAAASGLAAKGGSTMMTFADFDNDGDLDAYLVTYFAFEEPGDVLKMSELQSRTTKDASGRRVLPPELRERYRLLRHPDGRTEVVRGGQSDRLWRNDGVRPDGTVNFVDVTEAAGVLDHGLGLAATWWDFDEDGWPDLYVSNDYFGADRLWHNERNGTFRDVAPALLPATPFYSMGSDFADIDNDGHLDFFASDMAGATHYRSKMGMGDMDRYGWFLETGNPRQVMRNTMFLGSGGGPFREVAHLLGIAATDWTWAVKFADLDGDGRDDLFVSNGMMGDFFNSDLADTMKADPTKVPPKRDADFAFRNTGALAFENVSKAWGVNREAMSFGAAYGDLDGDGDVDLIVSNWDEPPSIYENRIAGPQRLSVRLLGARNRWGVGARVELETDGLRQTRYLTLARGFAGSDEPVLHFGLGAAKEARNVVVRWPGGGEQRIASLKAGLLHTIEEPPDLPKVRPAETAPAIFRESKLLADARHSEKAFDDFAREPLLPNKLSQLGPGIAFADIDGDGDDDFFLGGAAGSDATILRNESGRQFAKVPSEVFDEDGRCEDMGAVFFDADGDGDQDLFVVSGSNEYAPDAHELGDRLYLNDGRGEFRKSSALPDDRDAGGPVCVADFDRDGDLDIFIGGRVVPGKYPLSPRSRLLRNDGGRFTDATPKELAECGMVTAAVWSDVDNDGWVDLILAVEWGPMRLFHNDHGSLADATKAAGLEPFTGWWNSVHAVDLDGDGDLDLVAGNFGLNTKYHADAAHPAMIYHGVFDDTGVAQIIEAKQGDGAMFPVRGKSCSQDAIPDLRARFPKFHDFASATLVDIYSTAGLEHARKFEATTLESGVFWNHSTPDHPAFRFTPLPRLAQVAPVFGIASADFDGDGNLDLVLAQNFHNPQRETGRMNGGLSLLLLGDGKGGLTPVAPERSGIAITGDAKSLVATDINGDGRVDLVFGMNDGPVRVLENQHGEPHWSIVVRLVGKPGNPTGVGARVEIETAGRRLLSEVSTGGGYLSQSPARLRFPMRAGEEPKAVKIRWADGKKSTHPWPGATEAVFKQN